jgi:hypothetical protein
MLETAIQFVKPRLSRIEHWRAEAFPRNHDWADQVNLASSRRGRWYGDGADDAETAGSGFALTRSLVGLL